jgi:hypothetical protein
MVVQFRAQNSTRTAQSHNEHLRIQVTHKFCSRASSRINNTSPCAGSYVKHMLLRHALILLRHTLLLLKPHILFPSHQGIVNTAFAEEHAGRYINVHQLGHILKKVDGQEPLPADVQ